VSDNTVHISHAMIGGYIPKWGRRHKSINDAVGLALEDHNEAVLCLLSAILVQIDKSQEQQTETSDEFFGMHKCYLTAGLHKRDSTLIKSAQTEIKRVCKFVPRNIGTSDFEVTSIHRLARLYRNRPEDRWRKWDTYGRQILELKEQITRLKQCRSVDDVAVLKNVGKKKAEKIKAAYEASLK
jgi:hypothetical protein